MPTRALIHSFVDAAPHLGWANRPDGTTEFVNQRLVDYVGRTAEEIAGNAYALIVHSDDRPAVLQVRSENIARRQPYCVEYRLRRYDGVHRWHSAHIAPLLGGDGEVIAWYGSAIDIDDRHRAADATREAEQRFRTLAEQASDAIFVHDEKGRFLDVNEQACRSLGYCREELLQKTVYDVDLDFGVEQAESTWPQVFSGELRTVIGRQRRRDGSVFPVEVRLSVLERSGQQLYLALARDITQRLDAEQHLRESEQRFRSLVEATSQVVWTCPPCGNQAKPQAAWQQFTGQTEEDVLGWGWLNALHAGDREAARECWERAVATSTTFDVECRVRRHDGEWRWMQVRAAPVFDPEGNIREWVGANSDITRRKQAEEALWRSNQDLQRFSYVVSHDLQDPLRQVAVFSQMLARTFGSADPQAKELSDYLVQGVQRMRTIIKDLLLMAHPEREIPAECFEAEEAVQDAIAAVQDYLNQTGGKVVIDQPLPKLVAPRPVVRQAFQNLLSNAIKYRKSECPLEIHIGGVRRGQEWTFSVSDNGQGIPFEYRDRMFQWFSRAPGTKAPGNGIGLASVERMLARVGGRIWVESEVGAGSTFHFTVPASDDTVDC